MAGKLINTEMAGNEYKWQAEVISNENGRQRVQMAGRTEVEAYGRQNWQANSYILKWQAISINGRQKSYQVKMAGKESKWQAEL